MIDPQRVLGQMQGILDAATTTCNGDPREMVAALIGAVVIASAMTSHFDEILQIAIASLEQSRQLNKSAGLPNSHVCACSPRGEPS